MMSKKLLTLIAFTGLTALAFGQANQKGNFMIDIGFGGGYYSYDYQHTYQGVTLADTTDDAATSFFLLDFEYSFADWFSLGARFKNGKYLEDNANADNKFSVFEIAGRFYFLNNDKFTLNGRLGFGSSTLREEGVVLIFPYSTKWSGAHTSLGVGFKWMFANNIGLMLDYEHDIYRLDLKEFKINGDSQDLSDRTWNYDVNGNELILGLVIRL